MPQPKKDTSVRARANRASTRSNLNGERKVETPELPSGHDWLPATREWWADLWDSPMASEYHSSDRHALFILAALVDEFWAKPTKDLAGEIRLQRQAFGLTPYDRRRLEWTIEQTDEAKDRGQQRRQRSGAMQPKVGADPRSVLHAV